MNRATGILVAVAALSIIGAVAMRPSQMDTPTFEDTGEELFPEFSDPNAATFLEVKAYDDKEARLVPFSVTLTDGRWVIPSHNDYPADGTERMGKAAASFIGAKKDVVRSDDPNDHAEFGVLDPEDGSAGEGERGQRVTIKDAAGTALVDVIIGKEVPGKQGFRFLRHAGENRVYAVQIDPQISTKFTDWIEDDLLKLETDDIVAVLSNSYTVDEKTGTVENDNPLYFELRETGAIGADGSASKEWVLADLPMIGPDGKLLSREAYAALSDERVQAGGEPLPELPPPPAPPEGKVVKDTAIKQTVGAADRVKIVGVRPQPQQLSALDLLSKGFFVGGEPPNQRLYGNEGELRLFARDGVVYTLYFGEVTYATGETLTAGGEGELQEETQDGENQRANRYMFVGVGYDPNRDLTGGEGSSTDDLRGEARAQALAQRFNKWFYVIPDLSFTQLHKVPDDFWKAAAE